MSFTTDMYTGKTGLTGKTTINSRFPYIPDQTDKSDQTYSTKLYHSYHFYPLYIYQIQLSRGTNTTKNTAALNDAPRIKKRQWKDPRTGKVRMVPVDLDPCWEYNPGPAGLKQFRVTLLGKAMALPKDMQATALAAYQRLFKQEDNSN